MTTKEIAEVAGVSHDTASRKIKELFPEKIQKGKQTRLIQKEAIMVMAELRKQGYVQPTQNAEVPTQNSEAVDIAFKAALITLTNMAQNMESRLSKIETKIEQRQALLPAPQIKPRDHISMLVREHAHAFQIDYPEAWGYLYKQFSYRTNTNPRERAKNRGMTIIDYIETEGMIDTLESVAMEVMG